MVKFFLSLSVFSFVTFIVCCIVDSTDTLWLWFVLFFLSLAIAIITAIYKAAKATIEVAGQVVEFTCELVTAIVSGIIDALTIKDEVRKKVPNAVKLLIQEKKKTAVKVGIFDNKEMPICQLEIEGDGVQDDVRVGQIIYMH